MLVGQEQRQKKAVFVTNQHPPFSTALSPLAHMVPAGYQLALDPTIYC
jgi:hypothetical protein